jgi:hypothetical protein
MAGLTPAGRWMIIIYLVAGGGRARREPESEENGVPGAGLLIADAACHYRKHCGCFPPGLHIAITPGLRTGRKCPAWGMLPLAGGLHGWEGNLLILGDDDRGAGLNTGVI